MITLLIYNVAPSTGKFHLSTHISTHKVNGKICPGGIWLCVVHQTKELSQAN
jgi:hypothetical protein